MPFGWTKSKNNNMSIDITFEKRLNLKEIQEKTDILVDEHKGKKYLKYDGSTLPINDLDENENFTSISQYGLNTLGGIMNIIVPTFQTRFITDEVFEDFIHEQMKGKEYTLDEMDNIWTETTIHYGYEISKNGIITKSKS